MSMSKGHPNHNFIWLGREIIYVCEKHISSLDDVVSKYVPETEQTIYKDAKIGDMINVQLETSQYGIKRAITCVNTRH